MVFFDGVLQSIYKQGEPQMPSKGVKLTLILFSCEDIVESRERKDVERIQAAGRKRSALIGGDRVVHM